METAADVLGVFREVAHEVYTLAEVARRIDASLARRLAAGQAHGSRPGAAELAQRMDDDRE